MGPFWAFICLAYLMKDGVNTHCCRREGRLASWQEQRLRGHEPTESQCRRQHSYNFKKFSRWLWCQQKFREYHVLIRLLRVLKDAAYFHTSQACSGCPHLLPASQKIVSWLFLLRNELQLAFQGQITICPKLFLTFWEKWMILRYKRLCNHERMRWISVQCMGK